MKTKILSLICMITGIMMLSSCKDHHEIPMIDALPVHIQVQVQNEYGDNLLDENFADNILNKDIYVTFKGEKYPLLRYGSRLLPATFSSPVISENTLIIGELDGQNYLSTVVLHLGRVEYIITFENKWEYDKKTGKGYFIRKFYLDDELVDAPALTIVGKINIVLNPYEI